MEMSASPQIRTFYTRVSRCLGNKGTCRWEMNDAGSPDVIRDSLITISNGINRHCFSLCQGPKIARRRTTNMGIIGKKRAKAISLFVGGISRMR